MIFSHIKKKKLLKCAKTRYLFTTYGFCYKPHVLLHNSRQTDIHIQPWTKHRGKFTLLRGFEILLYFVDWIGLEVKAVSNSQKFGSALKTIQGPSTKNRCLVYLRSQISNLKMIRRLVFEQIENPKNAQGRKSKLGSDIHTPGHIVYLHTKCHHRTTSNKKDQKFRSAPKMIQGLGTKNRFQKNVIVFACWVMSHRSQISNLKMIRLLVFEQTKKPEKRGRRPTCKMS